MSDVRRILACSVLGRIIQRCNELEQQACALPQDSSKRRAVEKLIGKLQEYALDNPDAPHLELNVPIADRLGQRVGEWHSFRDRYVKKRRGRRSKWRALARIALEERLANPELMGLSFTKACAKLAKKMGVPRDVLDREMHLLVKLLKQERIKNPTAANRRSVENGVYRTLNIIDPSRPSPPDPFEFLSPKPKNPSHHKSRKI
jgi:hypothetical protein